MMITCAKTKLERLTLDRFHQLHVSSGFPSENLIKIIGRKNTGGGRYVELDCATSVQMQDGYLDLDGGFIEMSGISHGMMAVVKVEKGRLQTLEFTVYGGEFWDGVEREWKII